MQLGVADAHRGEPVRPLCCLQLDDLVEDGSDRLLASRVREYDSAGLRRRQASQLGEPIRDDVAPNVSGCDERADDSYLERPNDRVTGSHVLTDRGSLAEELGPIEHNCSMYGAGIRANHQQLLAARKDVVVRHVVSRESVPEQRIALRDAEL
ncbi:MAG: hypothetical protein ACRDJM_03735 [Actinomycetota bacterium]